MSGTDIVIYVLASTVLICACTICVFVCIIYKLSSLVESRDKSIDILCRTAEDDFKAVNEWQSKYMNIKDDFDKLRIGYEHLKSIHDDLHVHYDIAYTEYEYCRHERDDYKKRLEKYEHNVI